jgi:hypothetical protein
VPIIKIPFVTSGLYKVQISMKSILMHINYTDPTFKVVLPKNTYFKWDFFGFIVLLQSIL